MQIWHTACLVTGQEVINGTWLGETFKVKAKNRISLVSAVALAGGVLALGAPAAHAGLVGIGLSTSFGGPITTEAVNPGVASFTGSYGSFSLNILDGADTSATGLPYLLNTTIQDSTSTGGTLYVWISSVDLSQPTTLGSLAAVSSFTSNILPTGWTVSEYTYLDTTDKAWSGAAVPGNLVGSTTFTAIGTDVTPSATFSLNGLFSMTELYVITAPTHGSTLDTISAYVPEPSSLGILGLGLSAIGALGWIRRRRSQKSVK